MMVDESSAHRVERDFLKDELSNIGRKGRWHDRMTLLVGGLASIAAIASVAVAQKQANLMDLARRDAVESAKQEALDAFAASKIAGREAQASADQAASLSKQVRIIADQLQISRNQAASNGAQARSMESLAAASRSQASSQSAQLKRMDRMAIAAENQLNIQISTSYEAIKPRFVLDFQNPEMNSLIQYPYDPSLPYNLNFTYQNAGINSAIVVARIETMLLRPGQSGIHGRCLKLKCSGSAPVLIAGGATGSSNLSLPKIDIALESLQKEDYALAVFLVVDWRDVTNGYEDYRYHCKMYQFAQKQWIACPQTS